MKASQDVQRATIGMIAAFVAHALEMGVSLDAPIEFHKGRGTQVVRIDLELTLPGFESPRDAAEAVTSDPEKQAARAPRRRQAAAATTPEQETPAEQAAS